MTTDPRALEIARCAVGLASLADVVLPDALRLWDLVGGRPPSAPPVEASDPARHLGEGLERTLSVEARKMGAHYTPAPVAERVAALALAGHPERPCVVDPACGGGALLLAAARRLAADGLAPATIAEDLLWGADIDPLAVAVTEAAIALWAGGTVPAPGQLVVGDTLRAGPGAWPAPPAAGFEVVIGNPPFQGQLNRKTARRPDETAELRSRFGSAVATYVDTAALFLLSALELARPGGRVALVQPQSVVASRDAGGVREALSRGARLVDLWVPPGHLFDAKVHVCVPVLEVVAEGTDGERRTWVADVEVGRGGVHRRPAVAGPADPGPEFDGGIHADWRGRWAQARGIPEVSLGRGATLADLATSWAGFRDEYYGLVGHVREAEPGAPANAPLVTSGLIDVGRSAWGERTVRFAKHTWNRPEVDLVSLRQNSLRTVEWVDRLRRPKVVVASQTRVVEAAVDRTGTWVPSTPVISVVPHDLDRLDAIAAILCSPPVSTWAARRTAGTALSSGAMRISAALLLTVPLPSDRPTWDEAARLLAAGDLAAYAEAATAMFHLPPTQADEVLAWWLDRAKLTWPSTPEVR